MTEDQYHLNAKKIKRNLELIAAVAASFEKDA